ncbi:carbamoyl-phosphate synthase small subunit, partial [Acinetobacter baumannii]|nr:carbamoyl-phosphate synthase small subunit [Acinetobacter baumannii]
MSPPAILALADGTIFKGTSIGATGSTTGEVVFNTAMTGYQEILT